MPTRRALQTEIPMDAVETKPDESWAVPVVPPGSNAIDIDDDEDTPADRVFAMLDAARDAERATVKLFRVLGPGKFGWCDDYTIDDFEAGGFAMIRDKWGPGEYEIRLYAIRPSDNRFGVRAKPRVTIVDDGREIAKNSASPAVDPAMREMLSQMAATQNRMLEALANRPDPMAQMQTVIAVAGAMRQAFGIGEQSQQKSSIAEVVQAVRELRSVSEEINPPKPAAEDDSDNPMKLLPGVLDVIGKIAGQQSPQPQPQAYFPPVALPQSVGNASSTPVANAVSLPVANPSDPAVSEIPTPNDEEMNALQLILFRGYIGKLCGMSASGNIDAAANYALDKMPDEAIDILETDNWFDALAQFYPPAVAHRVWLEQVRAKVVAMLADDDAGNPVSGQ